MVFDCLEHSPSWIKIKAYHIVEDPLDRFALALSITKATYSICRWDTTIMVGNGILSLA